jgi:patatin-like phospholipase/acyl hydrolase
LGCDDIHGAVQAKRNPLENPPLKLVCQASTAAPTYLPAVQFSIPEAAEGAHPAPHTRQFNMVDGGVAVNNPVIGFSSFLIFL